MRSLVLVLCVALPTLAHAYPTDQYERTKIRRLVWQHEVDEGVRHGRKTPEGARWPASRITLKMTDAGKSYRLTTETPKDPQLQQGLEKILRKRLWHKYHVAILDITHPDKPRYAAVGESEGQTPGSVAKILIGAALFDAVAKRFPNDIAAREAFLRNTMVAADDWAMPNHHEVPVVWGDKLEHVSIRPVRTGDTFSLWEWVDHALSPSSNASASMVWREVTLMNLLGADYPPPKRDRDLWARWDKQAFSDAAFAAVDAPLKNAGIDPATFSLRLFYTRGAGKYIHGDSSTVTPLALVQWMLAVEQGRMVDSFSSLELKRLLYLTRRRIRYAKAEVLKPFAVFFKSGSLFRCAPEEGYHCAQYEGNVVNVLNALVEVETAPVEGKPTRVYIVAVMSNELKRNAAEDHQDLAGSVHALIEGLP